MIDGLKRLWRQLRWGRTVRALRGGREAGEARVIAPVAYFTLFEGDWGVSMYTVREIAVRVPECRHRRTVVPRRRPPRWLRDQ